MGKFIDWGSDSEAPLFAIALLILSDWPINCFHLIEVKLMIKFGFSLLDLI